MTIDREIARLGAAYGAEIRRGDLERYAAVLRDVSLDAVRRAVSELIDADTWTRMPPPAAVLRVARRIDRALTDLQDGRRPHSAHRAAIAQRHLDALCRAIERVESRGGIATERMMRQCDIYREIAFRDPSPHSPTTRYSGGDDNTTQDIVL